MRRTVTALGLIAVVLMAPPPAAAQDPPPETGPVRQFIQTIGRDFKSMASHESVPLLSAAAAFAVFVQPFDATLSYSASCSTFLKTTFDGWSRVAGQEWLLASGALGTYVAGRATGNPRAVQVGRDLLEAGIVAGIATTTLKVATRRRRPDGEPRSFPSGHASGTFALATVIQRHFGWKGAVPAYTAAFLVSGARLQHHSHYPTDVIAGAALGILAGRAATVEIAGARVSASPAILPGGGAITFSIRPDKE